MVTTSAGQEMGLRSLLSKLQSIDIDDIETNEEAKIETLKLAQKVTAKLEGPLNRATDFVFRPFSTIAARIAIDLDLFTHISNSSGTVTSRELADASGGSEDLIHRLLRLLAAVNLVEEAAPGTWAANDTTKAMSSAPIAAGHRFVFDSMINSAVKAPKFLRETNFKTPSEPNDGFVQYAFQTKSDVFGFLHSNPSLFRDFNLFMGDTMGDREFWYDWYDIDQQLLRDFDNSKGLAFLVDIGGGKGHDIVALDIALAGKPNLAHGTLVLEDLPQVLGDVDKSGLKPTIRMQPYDFFTEQPVKGARAYFLHHILHDWSEKYCHLILKRVREAMTPGYSKLIIHELILPDTGATEMQARFDFVMMTFNAGMERSRMQWTKLLEDAGFCKIKIWEHLDHDGIIEAEVAAKPEAT